MFIVISICKCGFKISNLSILMPLAPRSLMFNELTKLYIYFPVRYAQLVKLWNMFNLPKLAKTPLRRHFSFPFLTSMSLCLPFLFNIQFHQIISYFPAQAFNLHIGGFNLIYLIGLAYRHMDYCLQGADLAFGISEQSTYTIYN